MSDWRSLESVEEHRIAESFAYSDIAWRKLAAEAGGLEKLLLERWVIAAVARRSRAQLEGAATDWPEKKPAHRATGAWGPRPDSRAARMVRIAESLPAPGRAWRIA